MLTPRRPFLRDDRAIAATEFALVTPFMLLLLLGGFDVGRFALCSQRIEDVANTVAEMLAQTTSSAGAVERGDSAVSDAQLGNFRDAAMFVYPEALAEAGRQGVSWASLLDVQMTSLRFKVTPEGCTMSCNYTPQVVWSTGLRPCNTVFAPASDTASPNPTTLPASVFGPNSLLVVDVSYQYTPNFASAFLPSITVRRSVYLTPRNVPIVETAGSQLAPNCPGVL